MPRPIQLSARSGGTFNSPYDGLLATRCDGAWHGQIDMTNKQMMVRSTHVSRSTITSIKLLIPNSLVTAAVETGVGGSVTISASIEYPSGTCTRVQFSGSDDGTITNNNLLLSDATTIAIPTDTTFWVRMFFRSASGVIYSAAQSNAPTITGDQIKLAVSGLTDQVMTGDAITGGSSNIMYFPAGIIGPTTLPSVVIPGDSTTHGINADPNTLGDKGCLSPSIGAYFGYAKTAIPGERVGGYNSSCTQRKKIYDYATHVVTNFGVNDLAADQVSLATLKTRINTFASNIPAGVKLFWCTLSPGTSTSDSCTTLGGQSIPPEGQFIQDNKVQFNDDLRSGAFAPGYGYFEMADVLETSRNSGRWITSPRLSNDCAHLNTLSCNTTLPASGAIDHTRITRP